MTLDMRLRASMLAAALGAADAAAQERPAAPAVTLDPVVVTATRVEERGFDVPASIDAIDGGQVRDQQLKANISETLQRVPGIVANNRQNYAQDLQISSRGFGARAAFGVRGVRLVQDGIPLTMPDGQGQTGLFDLDSARRIEVLRGPFAWLYGNSSGGVIQLFTEDGPSRPTLWASGAFGSYDTWRAAVGFGGQAGAWNYIGNLSRFSTDGYRDHSAAVRTLGNVKVAYAPDADSSITVIGNGQWQPDTLDPLGLTAAQVEQDPRQAGTGAVLFDTRKSIYHHQAGIVFDRRLSQSDSIRALGYGGTRQVTQYLAFTGAAPTSSGGVVDLDRDFGGLGLQWTHTGEVAGGPYTLTLGADYDRMTERRQGFVNDFGVQGALRRDEDDTVYDFDQYVIGEWKFAPRWRLSGGLRHSKVSYRVQDDYITAANPDDSGSVRYSHTSPVVGLVFALTPTVNLYAAAGWGFETPTLAELAYRPDGQPGPNFALQPSTTTNFEIGAKALVGESARINVALFAADTRDDIITAANVGGRSTFTNAARTRRAGFEIAAEAELDGGFSVYGSYTFLDAEFREYMNVFSGQNLSGNKLPGVPQSAFWGEITWRYAPLGFSTAIEARYSAKVYADDANTAAADSYFVANWRAGFEQRVGGWRFAEFLRVDNLADQPYVGSVIVNQAAQRFFEPSPTRNYLVGATASYAFR